MAARPVRAARIEAIGERPGAMAQLGYPPAELRADRLCSGHGGSQRPRSHRLRVVQPSLGSRARARGRTGDDLRAGPALSGTPAHRGIQTQESSLDAPARAPGFLAGLARATHEASR